MYLRYLIRQFPQWGPAFELTFENDKSPNYPGKVVRFVKKGRVSVLLLLVIFYGLITHIRYSWRRFSALLLFFLVSSVGLVVYLNMNNPQVRERAYFYLGSFYIIMYWVGMGVDGLITDIRGWLSSRVRLSILVPVNAALFFFFGTLAPA